MKSRLSRTGDRFQTLYHKIDGTEFYGHVLDIPDTSRVSNFFTARRYLRTKATIPNIAPGAVIIVDNQIFIVADHGTGFHFEPIYKHFKLFEVDTAAVWEKVAKTTNAITGVKETGRSAQATVAYLSTQPKNTIEDSLHVQQQTYTAITNAAVQKNDVVNGKIVTKVDPVLGVWVIELKDK